MTDLEHRLVAELYRGGLTCVEIGDIAKVAPSTVYRSLLHTGTPRRAKGTRPEKRP